MAERYQWQPPTLEDIARDIWEVEALTECGDPALAKRLVAARYWLETRRPGADGHRVLLGPATEEAPE